MQTPKRKPGKYSGLKKDALMTRSKYRELEDKLHHMKKRGRPRLAAETRTAAQDGDFSENAAYQIAKGRLRGLNRRIDEIEDLLRRAEIIEESGRSGRVAVGSTVTVSTNGREKTYRILGAAETDPARGIISRSSPLARALLGRGPGDIIDIIINGKEKKYKIIKIS